MVLQTAYSTQILITKHTTHAKQTANYGKIGLILQTAFRF